MTANRVLCVEDDADTRELLKAKLGFSDLEAVGVPNVDAALRLMERERFSLYILDGGLRGVSGLSLCEQIRAADARTPIVIFSGNAHASDIEAGMSAGADAYIVKPNSSELIPTIRRLLEATSFTPVKGYSEPLMPEAVFLSVPSEPRDADTAP